MISISYTRSAILLVALIGLLVIATLFDAALPVMLREGAFVGVVCFAAFGLGVVCFRLLRLPIDPLDHAVMATATGTGVLSLLVFILGSVGFLDRALWIGIVAALVISAAIGLFRLRAAIRPPSAWWLLAAPFFLLATLAACVPPGILWPDEGFGYDVLEYHLAAPKEFLANGRVSFLPHNIYANMPFAAEMMYLLGMVLRGGAFEGLFAAQFMHVAWAVMAAFATAAAVRPLGRSASLVAGLCVACCPILTYFAGVAYVEGGMLAMTATAMGCVVRMQVDAARRFRWAALAGVLVGLASGFKYTAIPMIALPVVLTPLLMSGMSVTRRIPAALLIACCAAVCFSPWAIRNFSATGNPLFPLARSVFPERGGVWADDLAANWRKGHLPNPANRSVAGRVRALWQQVARSNWYGPLPALAVLSAAAWWLGRRCATTPGDHREAEQFLFRSCIVLIVAVLGVWLSATHLVARFAMPLVPALAMTVGLAVGRLANTRAQWAAAAVLAVAWFASTVCVFSVANPQVLLACSDVMGKRDVTKGPFPVYVYLPRLNEVLAAGRRVLVIGEVRTLYFEAPPDRYDYRVVFNRSPFAEAAARMSPPELLGWISKHGFDLVFLNWSEMHRLKRTYGFYPSVNDQLFIDLVEAGLQPVEHFRMSDDAQAPFATLFAVRGGAAGIR